MGITGLLPMLKAAARPCHVRELRGQRVAVDTYCWLHKGAFSASRDICLGIPTERHVDYCMQRVDMLLSHGVTPILVFDGGPLPSKGGEEERRKKSRRENMNKALQFEEQGNRSSAMDYFQRAVDISPALAAQLIQVLRQRGIQYVVAPYEADAQLTHLCRTNEVDAVITEDSDLVAYGCPRILFKMDRSGSATELCHANIASIKEPSFAGFTQQMILEMCIFSGCDYLASLPGLGLKKSFDLIVRHKNFQKAIKAMRFNGRQIPSDFEVSFERAVWTFRHQRVFDRRSRQLVHLEPLPAELQAQENLDFLGPDLEPELAIQIAEGHVDPITYEPFNMPCVPTPSTPTAMRQGIGAGPSSASQGLGSRGAFGVSGAVLTPRAPPGGSSPSPRGGIEPLERKRRPNTTPLPVQKNKLSKYFVPSSTGAKRQFQAPRCSPQAPSEGTPSSGESQRASQSLSQSDGGACCTPLSNAAGPALSSSRFCASLPPSFSHCSGRGLATATGREKRNPTSQLREPLNPFSGFMRGWASPALSPSPSASQSPSPACTPYQESSFEQLLQQRSSGGTAAGRSRNSPREPVETEARDEIAQGSQEDPVQQTGQGQPETDVPEQGFQQVEPDESPDEAPGAQLRQGNGSQQGLSWPSKSEQGDDPLSFPKDSTPSFAEGIRVNKRGCATLDDIGLGDLLEGQRARSLNIPEGRPDNLLAGIKAQGTKIFQLSSLDELLGDCAENRDSRSHGAQEEEDKARKPGTNSRPVPSPARKGARRNKGGGALWEQENVAASETLDCDDEPPSPSALHGGFRVASAHGSPLASRRVLAPLSPNSKVNLAAVSSNDGHTRTRDMSQLAACPHAEPGAIPGAHQPATGLKSQGLSKQRPGRGKGGKLGAEAAQQRLRRTSKFFAVPKRTRSPPPPPRRPAQDQGTSAPMEEAQPAPGPQAQTPDPQAGRARRNDSPLARSLEGFSHSRGEKRSHKEGDGAAGAKSPGSARGGGFAVDVRHMPRFEAAGHKALDLFEARLQSFRHSDAPRD